MSNNNHNNTIHDCIFIIIIVDYNYVIAARQLNGGAC